MVERIREILQANQLTPTQFADHIGVARPIISHILSGRNKPSLEVVQKIIAAFPKISIPWLLSGVGSMSATAASTTPDDTAADATSPGVAPADPVTARRNGRKAPKAALLASQSNSGAPGAVDPEPSLPAGLFDAEAAMSLSSAALPPNAPVQRAARPAPNRPASALKQFVGASEQASAVTQTVPQAPQAATSSPAPSAAPPPVPAFAEPGKSIRRIVIFYQDGTFTDYRPEDGA